MTIEEIISKVDDLSPNQYTQEQKIGWLSTLDGQIYNDVIATHEGNEFLSWDPYETDEVQLIVDAPYAEDLYPYYLMAQISAFNAELVKYNQFMTLFNRAFQNWANFYNRTHMPLQHGKWVM